MASFRKVTMLDGRKILVNLDRVDAIYQMENSSEIEFTDGTIEVKETIDDILGGV